VTESSVFGKSLLERAGLEGRRSKAKPPPAPPPSKNDATRRYDLLNDEPGQLRFGKVGDEPV
jgi:hypothetical protein